MGVFKNSKGSLCTMNVLIIKLVVWLGWLSSVAVGQLELSESITGFVNFPEVGISAIGNLAVLITSISKGRLDLELGARDVLASIRGPKPKPIHGIGFTTCPDYEDAHGFTTCPDYEDASVVMLSYNTPNSSTKDFMQYVSNAHKVHSIFLKCFPLKSAALVADICNCNHSSNHTCKCVVICTVEEITTLLDRKMPGIVKRLSDSQSLLPSADCLRNDCHGCNERRFNVQESFAACEILEIAEDSVQKKNTCICIPLKEAANDDWTKLLTKSFRSKDTEDRKVSVMASDAMEHYTAQDDNNTYSNQRRREWLSKGLMVEFHTTSLILPRLVEILVNILLVVWFRVDGFSTSMVARKAVKKYVVGSKKSGFAANAFLSRALVKSEDSKSNDNDTPVRHVCQVLTFRRSLPRLKTLSFTAGTVNLLCAIFWAVCTGIEVKWYVIDSLAPSIARVVAIIIVIGFALAMDGWHLVMLFRAEEDATKVSSPTTGSGTKEDATKVSSQTTGSGTKEDATKVSWSGTIDRLRKRIALWAVRERKFWAVRERVAVLAVILVEITCVALGISGAAGAWGKNHVFGKWVYSGVQALVWVKWGIGSYLLGESSSAESNSAYNWGSGVLVYSSAFLLNSGLAAVRCKWKYLPSN